MRFQSVTHGMLTNAKCRLLPNFMFERASRLPLRHFLHDLSAWRSERTCTKFRDYSHEIFFPTQVYKNAPKPSVTCSKFLTNIHDVRRNKVSASGLRSALDSVDVSDPVVANFLIDQVSMESILLVPEHGKSSQQI